MVISYFDIPRFFSNLSFLAFVVYVFLGVYVLFRDTKSSLNRIFFLLSFIMAVWSFTYSFIYPQTNKEICWFWYKPSSIGWTCVASVLLHFFLDLTGKKNILKKWWIYVVLYLPPLIFIYRVFFSNLIAVDFEHSNFGTLEVQTTNSIWPYLLMIDLISKFIIGFVFVWLWGKNSQVLKDKKQANMILVTAFVPVVGGFLSNMLLPLLNIKSVPAISQILSLIWFFGIWYSIVKYKFMVLTTKIAVDEIIFKIRDLMMLVSPDGKIIKINHPILELLGYTHDELIGTPYHMLFLDKDFIEVKFSKMKEDFYAHKFEYYCKTKSGKNIMVDVSGEAIRDKAGELIGVVIVAQDIRSMKQLKQEIIERKQAQEALIETNEKLKELDMIKTEFLSTVSHELRTPLTSILGFSKIIKKKMTEVIIPLIGGVDNKADKAVNQVVDNVDIIISEAHRLTDLINDVLDIAKMDTGKSEWKRQKISIEEVVDRAIAVTSSLLVQKELSLRKEVEACLPHTVGDIDRIIQVLINLISNAVKFTEKGTIYCKAKKVKDEIIVSVIDSGIGIHKENYDRVFEKFKQVGDTLTNKPRGTGLGLPICKQIIEYHGGRIWVESEIDNGSNFSFSLPVLCESD